MVLIILPLLVVVVEFIHQGKFYNHKKKFLTKLINIYHFFSIYLVDTLNSRLYIEKIIGKTVKDLLRPNICGGNYYIFLCNLFNF